MHVREFTTIGEDYYYYHHYHYIAIDTLISVKCSHLR
jgi:hypothetical protein